MNNSCTHFFIVGNGGESISYDDDDDDEHWNAGMRTRAIHHTRHRRRPSSGRKGKEEVGTGDGLPTRRRATFWVD